jgi:hypothetical protein
MRRTFSRGNRCTPRQASIFCSDGGAHQRSAANLPVLPKAAGNRGDDLGPELRCAIAPGLSVDRLTELYVERKLQKNLLVFYRAWIIGKHQGGFPDELMRRIKFDDVKIIVQAVPGICL